MTKIVRPRAGEQVVLVAIPPGLLDGLPDDDQRAINAIVGKPIKFIGYDDIGRAELEFDDPFNDSSHTIWVKPEFIQRDGAAQRAPRQRHNKGGARRLRKSSTSSSNSPRRE